MGVSRCLCTDARATLACPGLWLQLYETMFEGLREAAQDMHLCQLRAMECLLAAGYRPVTYRSMVVPGRGPVADGTKLNYYPPADPGVASRWELTTGNR